jgi:hypothetical protein
MSKNRKKENTSRFLGNFTFRDGESVVGELQLKGSDTLLKLHSDQPLNVTDVFCINGVAYSGEALTLIDCNSPGMGHISSRPKGTQYHAKVFPHYVTVGQFHLNQDQPSINTIEFTTTDIATLFYDFDAFGSVIEASSIIDAALQEPRKNRPITTGPLPLVQYFTGKDCIAEVHTDIGTISVHHRPSSSIGDPTGVFIKNHIVVSIRPNQPVHFDDAIERMYATANFLSVAGGRAQGVEHVRIITTDIVDDIPQSLSVHPSYRWKAFDKTELHEPQPGDVPLDPILRPAEFSMVLSDWVSRHDSWRIARSRYLGCLRKANSYDPDRLVAAANMFDILPGDAVPLNTELTEELAATRDTCVEMFRKHSVGIERNAALSALGRLGHPSLPKKVKHRVAVVESKLGDKFVDLQFVASVAIKCRNFFVHGNSGDIHYDSVEPLIPFLTDALEFIFATSDFIDAGWDARHWNSKAHSWGHSFSRFRSEYGVGLAELRRATDSS